MSRSPVDVLPLLYFNLPVGATVASAYRTDALEDVGESSFHVLASTISNVWVAPTPE